MTLHYDPADGSYTSSIPPGTAAFRKVVGDFYHFRTEVVRDLSRCRSALSEHCECRAVDAFVAAPAGRPLFDWAVAHADALGIQSVIHNRRVWGFGKWYERSYHGPSPHTDHVHIGLTKLAAATLTEAKVRANLQGAEDDMTPAEHQLLDDTHKIALAALEGVKQLTDAILGADGDFGTGLTLMKLNIEQLPDGTFVDGQKQLRKELAELRAIVEAKP